MRRQRELLLLQKRNQALASVSATKGAGFSSAADGAAPGQPPPSSDAYLASQRKELEGRLGKDEAAKQAELDKAQQQKASLNARLLKPLM